MPRKKKEETSGEKIKELADAKKEKAKKEEKKSEEKIKKTKTSDRSVLLRELKKKAKELAKGIEVIETKELKEELEKKRELLIPLEDYVRTGIHLGTKVITPDMKKYVYRRRADSIGVLNTTLIDEQLKKAIELISKYSPEEIILVCKREAGWKAANKFGEATNIKVYTKKYPAGMMTNPNLEEFYEPELIIACDAWIDKNALKEGKITNKKIIMLADTNNFTRGADVIVPCNNKGTKSIGLVFYLIARGYTENRKMNVKVPSIFSFTGEDLQVIPEIKEEPVKKTRKRSVEVVRAVA